MKSSRIEEYKTQLWQAGATGMLKGTLVALVSGYYFSYRYNHGQNTKFFKTPYKIWYLVLWNVVGLTFETDIAKINISRQAAIDDEIERSAWINDIQSNEAPYKKRN